MDAAVADVTRTTLEHCFVRIGHRFQLVGHFSKFIRDERSWFGWKGVLDRLLEAGIIPPLDNEIGMKLPTNKFVVLGCSTKHRARREQPGHEVSNRRMRLRSRLDLGMQIKVGQPTVRNERPLRDDGAARPIGPIAAEF